jgi:hypothetical protein
MHRVVIEFSHVDCILVSVDMGFFVEVIHLGLSGICSSWICCPLRYVWIIAVQCYIARTYPIVYWLYCYLSYFCLILQTTVLVFFCFLTPRHSLMFVFLDVSWICLCMCLLWRLDFLGSLFRVYVTTLLSGLNDNPLHINITICTLCSTKIKQPEIF